MWRRREEEEEEGRGGLRARYVVGKMAAVRWAGVEQRLVVPEAWMSLDESRGGRQTAWH